MRRRRTSRVLLSAVMLAATAAGTGAIPDPVLHAFSSERRREGNYPNYSDTIFRSIGRFLAPGDAPPAVPPFTKAC